LAQFRAERLHIIDQDQVESVVMERSKRRSVGTGVKSPSPGESGTGGTF
jgi:hypothetical protein